MAEFMRIEIGHVKDAEPVFERLQNEGRFIEGELSFIRPDWMSDILFDDLWQMGLIHVLQRKGEMIRLYWNR